MSSPDEYYYGNDPVYYGEDSDDDVDYEPFSNIHSLNMILGLHAMTATANFKQKIKTVQEAVVDTPDLTKMYEGADVILSVEGRQLFCNKQLLSLSSPVLEAAVVNTTHCNDGLVEVKLAGRKFEEMLWLMRWITPTIRNPLLMEEDRPCHERRAMTLLHLSVEYQIPALRENCMENLLRFLGGKSLQSDTIVDILHLAETYKLKTLFDKAVEVLAKQSHSSFCISEGYKNLDVKTKEMVLSHRIEIMENLMMQGCTYTPKTDLDPESAQEQSSQNDLTDPSIVTHVSRARSSPAGDENGKDKVKTLLETYIKTLSEEESKEQKVREEYRRTVKVLSDIKEAWEGQSAAGLCSQHQQQRGKRDYTCGTCEREFNFVLQRKLSVLAKYKQEETRAMKKSNLI